MNTNNSNLKLNVMYVELYSYSSLKHLSASNHSKTSFRVKNNRLFFTITIQLRVVQTYLFLCITSSVLVGQDNWWL